MSKQSMSHQIGPSKRLRQKYLICIQFLGRVQPLTDEEELKQRRKDLPLLDDVDESRCKDSNARPRWKLHDGRHQMQSPHRRRRYFRDSRHGQQRHQPLVNDTLRRQKDVAGFRDRSQIRFEANRRQVQERQLDNPSGGVHS